MPDLAEGQPTPIVLAAMGSFHIGGREIEITGKPVREVALNPGRAATRIDPNGRYQVEQMYVQYFVPEPRRGQLPLLLWHGGGLTGVTYETTPDGREGWLNWFVRQGWAVYNSDAVERGRSGFAPPEVFTGDALFLPKKNGFERFRIGDGVGSYDDDPSKRRVLSGNLFPADAYDQFCRQIVPRWTSTDPAITAAYLALLEKVGPSVVLIHSQSGQFGTTVAQARPDLVKALVLVEPAGFPVTEDLGALARVPMLAVYGDFIAEDARWPEIRAKGEAFLARVRAAGGRADVLDLPQAGIHGNSHMLMMDRNNTAIAELIQSWLAGLGLWR